MPHRSRPQPRSGLAHFTMLSRGRVYGIFQSLDDVQRCAARLLELGLADQAVQIIMGEDGEYALDVDGHRHGVWARFLRLMQGMTDERAHIEQYARALSCGEIVLSVDMTGSTGAVSAVAEAFSAGRARFVNYYGPWVVEPLRA